MIRLTEALKNFKTENGVNLLGITSAEPFENLRSIIEQTNKNIKEYTTYDIEKRIYPRLTMPNAKSIIAIGVNYYKELPEIEDNLERGIMSQITIGIDYHIHITHLLKKLAVYLLEFEQFDYKIFTDTGPLVDKAVAHRAGLGQYGRNNCIISKETGSFFNIGYIITSLNFKEYYNNNTIDICRNCDKCLKACPTGAISKNNYYNPLKCISFLTQTNKELSIKEQFQMGMHIYGCDICQNICPYNKKTTSIRTASLEEAYPLLNNIINITNSQYKKIYGKTACAWRGKKKLQQNAAIALANQRSKT